MPELARTDLCGGRSVMDVSTAIDWRTGELVTTHLGRDLAKGETFQHVVKANTWFAARLAVGSAFALVGCTVAPGFDFSDFQLADRGELSRQYPSHSEVIATLTR